MTGLNYPSNEATMEAFFRKHNILHNDLAQQTAIYSTAKQELKGYLECIENTPSIHTIDPRQNWFKQPCKYEQFAGLNIPVAKIFLYSQKPAATLKNIHEYLNLPWMSFTTAKGWTSLDENRLPARDRTQVKGIFPSIGALVNACDEQGIKELPDVITIGGRAPETDALLKIYVKRPLKT